MLKFSNHEEIKTAYDSGKYDIFFESAGQKYVVRNLGSTVYCYNPEKNMGMGAIHNFSPTGFYAIDKPEPEPEPVKEEKEEEV